MLCNCVPGLSAVLRLICSKPRPVHLCDDDWHCQCVSQRRFDFEVWDTRYFEVWDTGYIEVWDTGYLWDTRYFEVWDTTYLVQVGGWPGSWPWSSHFFLPQDMLRTWHLFGWNTGNAYWYYVIPSLFPHCHSLDIIIHMHAASARLLRLLVHSTSHKNKFQYQLSVSQYSQHYLGLMILMCTPPSLHPAIRDVLMLLPLFFTNSSLHSGTTQSAKWRSHWDARLSGVNLVFMPVPRKICHPSITIVVLIYLVA